MDLIFSAADTGSNFEDSLRIVNVRVVGEHLQEARQGLVSHHGVGSHSWIQELNKVCVPRLRVVGYDYWRCQRVSQNLLETQTNHDLAYTLGLVCLFRKAAHSPDPRPLRLQLVNVHGNCDVFDDVHRVHDVCSIGGNIQLNSIACCPSDPVPCSFSKSRSVLQSEGCPQKGVDVGQAQAGACWAQVGTEERAWGAV